jgi:hypothetical protein
MLRADTIKKSIAVLLLLVFTVSIAPKIFFHAAIAGHTDLPGCTDGAPTTHLHEEKPNCHFDDLVVSSPFSQQIDHFEFASYFFHPEYLNSYKLSYFSSLQLQKEGRGPPLG